MAEAVRGQAAVTAAKDIFIIAGPNGAGKTTFAKSFLPREGGCLTFINADYIAQGLSPLDPDLAAIRAGKLMLREMARLVEQGDSFTFETTLSGLIYSRMIPKWKSKGYTITLIFLRLESEEMAARRVRFRVSQGGHSIPEADIRRRFSKGLKNLEEIYTRLADHWYIYDNSGAEPVLMAQGRNQ